MPLPIFLELANFFVFYPKCLIQALRCTENISCNLPHLAQVLNQSW